MFFRPLMLLALLVLCLPASASAATAASGTDRSGDAIYPHMDIVSAYLAYDDDDSVAIGIGTRIMTGGDRLDIYVDTDLNGATGWYGADVAFFYEKFIEGQAMLTGVWNGAGWTIVQPQTLVYQTNSYSVALSIMRQELGAASAIRVFARGGHANIYGGGNSYSDWAPNTGSYHLSFIQGQVGGASGSGTVGASPTAFLTRAEARRATARAMRSRFGRRVVVSRRCTRISSTRRRCTATARKWHYIWRGQSVVREYVAKGRIRKVVVFSGKRYDTSCSRCTRTVRFTSRY